ncbi:hypothetical protein BD324DRAFT_616079 [Kockovaella imperatae]|uniref:BAR domain-domain-containing protein n=1 Tax=Kockovaella imperatae TaxID=4999 RepID=A0A1Y1UPX1_9TREE|nr:hypothetical protein BD324DRAFT_616079 [Kockovaella imperatae]ORX40049.1 hypothetical protein BD324DRAFT_616079 [Kockovaella imperatae]
MQRKALKQLGKVTQWTNEKVFNSEKTALPAELQQLEREIDPKKLAIERLHGTAMPFFNQLTKAKPTGDPYPPSSSAKDKILHTEALGLVMTDVGSELGGTWGEGLVKYGRARSKLAAAQEDFTGRLGETYIAGMENAFEVVNEYKTMRKKLDSRRLALDAAISKAQNSKKDTRALEFEVDVARERFEEMQEECQVRMVVIEQQVDPQWADLCELMEAELEYFTRCKEIMEELRNSWPKGAVTVPVTSRSRAKSNASAMSAGKGKSYGRSSNVPSDDEDEPSTNRSRSHSNASSLKGGRKSMLGALGSFGKKTGSLANLTLVGGTSKRKSVSGRDKDRDRYDGDNRRELYSDDEDMPASPSTYTGRSRSRSSLSGVTFSESTDRPPAFRRNNTAPLQSHAEGHWVKALYDFTGSAADELKFKKEDMIEVLEKVNDDWWNGECHGRHGLFPSAYVEEYVTPALASRPNGRSRARAATTTAVPESSFSTMNLNTSDSELEHGFSDAEQWQTASISMNAQRPSSQDKMEERAAPSRPGGRKPAPPPPPSRRSQSSQHIPSYGGSSSLSNSQTLAPIPAFQRRNLNASPEGSPFAGSEEDDYDDDEIFGGNGVKAPIGGSGAALSIDGLSSSESTTDLHHDSTYRKR